MRYYLLFPSTIIVYLYIVCLCFRISDYYGKILAVNSGHGGRIHDARVWNASIISAHLEQQFNNGQRNSWLLGILKTCIITSFILTYIFKKTSN